ncbi:MAG: hypothetical protein QF632_06695 [Candidatus Woesearchaeota archaeon]|nr:hypothetical protein [Candidatus Woesearchaeota archaeon]MDP7458565.1 hypothetical protein [Candidatus Woesearchaeota archaeon]
MKTTTKITLTRTIELEDGEYFEPCSPQKLPHVVLQPKSQELVISHEAGRGIYKYELSFKIALLAFESFNSAIIEERPRNFSYHLEKLDPGLEVKIGKFFPIYVNEVEQ